MLPTERAFDTVSSTRPSSPEQATAVTAALVTRIRSESTSAIPSEVLQTLLENSPPVSLKRNEPETPDGTGVGSESTDAAVSRHRVPVSSSSSPRVHPDTATDASSTGRASRVRGRRSLSMPMGRTGGRRGSVAGKRPTKARHRRPCGGPSLTSSAPRRLLVGQRVSSRTLPAATESNQALMSDSTVMRE